MKSKRFTQDALKLRASIQQPSGSKIARVASEGRIGRTHLGLNPQPKRKAKS